MLYIAKSQKDLETQGAKLSLFDTAFPHPNGKKGRWILRQTCSCAPCSDMHFLKDGDIAEVRVGQASLKKAGLRVYDNTHGFAEEPAKGCEYEADDGEVEDTPKGQQLALVPYKEVEEDEDDEVYSEEDEDDDAIVYDITLKEKIECDALIESIMADRITVKDGLDEDRAESRLRRRGRVLLPYTSLPGKVGDKVRKYIDLVGEHEYKGSLLAAGLVQGPFESWTDLPDHEEEGAQVAMAYIEQAVEIKGKKKALSDEELTLIFAKGRAGGLYCLNMLGCVGSAVPDLSIVDSHEKQVWCLTMTDELIDDLLEEVELEARGYDEDEDEDEDEAA